MAEDMSLHWLRRMKEAADRPQDRIELENLPPAANPYSLIPAFGSRTHVRGSPTRSPESSPLAFHTHPVRRPGAGAIENQFGVLILLSQDIFVDGRFGFAIDGGGLTADF